MAKSSGMYTMFDGVFPGNPGWEFLQIEIADITLTYPPLQPEAYMTLIDVYRTGRPNDFVQDLTGIGAYNTNTYNEVYPTNWRPPQRQSMQTVQQNIALIDVLAGLGK